MAYAAPTDGDLRFKEAIALQNQGKLDEARQKYLQALAVDSSPSILLNLALLERDAKRPLEALKYARAYLAHPRVKADKAAKVREDVLPGLVAQTARVEVVTNPGERIVLDGQDVGRAPLEAPLDVMPGSHILAAAGTTREVKLGAGEMQRLELKPPPPAVTPPPPTTSASPPTEPSPPAAATLPPKEAPPSTPASSGEGWRWAVPAGLGGAGVVSLGIGVFFFVKAGDAYSDAKSAASKVTGPCGGVTSGPCADERNALDSRRSDNGLGLGFTLGGAALVGAGAATYFVLRPATKSTALLVPFAAANAGGLVAVGSF